MSDLNVVLQELEFADEPLFAVVSPTPEQVEGWWKALNGRRKAPAAKAREELITHYAPLVTSIASRMIVRLPDSVELGDLVSYGMFGLIDAVHKFDLERGFKFETYAATRVRGAIIDEIRSTDWVPRSVRSKARVVETATRKLEQSLMRPVSDEDVADILDWDVAEVRTVRAQVALSHIAALDGISNQDTEHTYERTAASLRTPSASEPVDVRETHALLFQAIGEVRDREQEVLRLYYFENITLAQIGKVLGVTESRVSQIHTAAVKKLRESLVRTGAFD
jgi:RNA polymerase sigma factor for flagellar operon FliA